MKYAMVLIFGLLGLVGCQAQDENVRKVLNSVCPSVNVAYAHYQAVSVLVSERTQSRVEMAKMQADMLCAGRETATTVTILATGSAVYLAVRDAIKEARNNDNANAYSGRIDKLDQILRKAKE